jgi:tetratricopeptide (TPR) repeat protein
VRAMTHHHLGQVDEARRWLNKTREGFEQMIWDVHGHPFDTGMPRRNKFDLLSTYLLYREAETVLCGAPPADHPLRWIAQARGHACLGQRDEAAACFTRAIELRRQDPKLWLARAWFFARRGKWQEAAADFDQAFALGPLDRPGLVWEWLCRALVRLHLGDTEHYRRLCQEALDSFHPTAEDPLPAQQLALMCLFAPNAVPNLEIPVQRAEQALAFDPWSPWFLLTLAAARHRTGFSAEAILYLHWARRQRWPDPAFQNSGTVLVSLLLSLSYHHIGQLEEAHHWLEEAVHRMDQVAPPEDTGDLGEEWQFRLACQILRREAEGLPGLAPGRDPPARPTAPSDGATTVFDQAAKLRPKDARLWLTRGHLHARQGQLDAAAADFEQAFALQPSITFWEWYLHATLRLWADDAAGYRGLCKEMLERFGRAEHTDLWRCQALAMICLLARDAVPDVQVPTSLAEITVAAVPDNPWFLLTLGAARYRSGDFREAIRLFRGALQGSWPEDEESRTCGAALISIFLCLAHHHLGEVEEARQRLQEADRSIANAAAQEEGKGNRGKEWHIWAACQVLRREAEEARIGKVQKPSK